MTRLVGVTWGRWSVTLHARGWLGLVALTALIVGMVATAVLCIRDHDPYVGAACAFAAGDLCGRLRSVLALALGRDGA